METRQLTRTQFNILTCLEQNDTPLSQRGIAKKTGLSLGTVNKNMTMLHDEGWVEAGNITQKGLDVLEPYRVKRAIFIAAGFGSRLVPITLNTPKPLVRVNGTRMIDTLLDAVLAAGIEEIYVVRGYLGEQFDQLLYKYPMLHFVENPIYNEANNISSAMCVRHLLRSAYVLEADLVLYNPKLITKYQYCSNYLGVPVDTTDDWCLETQKQVITKVNVGGTNCHRMFGISYWSNEDGAKLYEDLKAVYEMPGGKERYWDQVPLIYCKEHYKIEVRECSSGDLLEIDSFKDLKEVDKTYC